ncbi:MAG: HD domain-containing protein [Eubacteriales bacterium]
MNGYARVNTGVFEGYSEHTETFRRAVDFAYQTYLSQLRESGEPHVVHPMEVARIVMDMGGDASSVIALVLHDVVEDGDNITVVLVERSCM